MKARFAELDRALFAEFPSAEETRQWILGHLPSGDGACLLHGDLLPQNLLWDWEASGRDEALIGIVDWEMACIGDPAYDLAIVSRGNRNVHGVKQGLKVLVEEYLAFGGRPISVTDVRVSPSVRVSVVSLWSPPPANGSVGAPASTSRRIV